MLRSTVTVVASISLLFSAGFAADCTLNEKLDSELCASLQSAGETDIIPFNLVLKQPVIEQPDKSTPETGAVSSSDVLTGYLETNRAAITSLLTAHTLYSAESLETPRQLSESDIVIDYIITAAATRETILALTASDLVARIEKYFKAEPVSVIRGDRGMRAPEKTTINRTSTTSCYDITGRLVRNAGRTSVNLSPSLYILTTDKKTASVSRIVVTP